MAKYKTPPVSPGHLKEGYLVLVQTEERKQRAGKRGRAGRDFKTKVPAVNLNWEKKA